MNLQRQYKDLIERILTSGEVRNSRNGGTKAVFSAHLSYEVGEHFPMITGRQIHYKGVLGEFAAFMHNCKTVKDFESFGCNYWELWADPTGRLELDYSEQLFNFNGVNQLGQVIQSIKEAPFSRRHIISLWRPDRFEEVSLLPCHYSYQFYITNSGKLNLLWNQRSVDVMIGLPSDIILANLWVILMAKTTGYKPGKVEMNFGDTHIYQEHLENAKTFVSRELLEDTTTYTCRASGILKFKPEMITIENYQHLEPLKFQLKA